MPGHEVVGEVVARRAPAVTGSRVGDRVGVAWLRHTCGVCRYCRRGAENLCPGSRYTGWDADGGYAEYAVVPAAFAYRLPGGYADAELAPLLCAGHHRLPRAAPRRAPAGRPARHLRLRRQSAHLAAQVAMARGRRGPRADPRRAARQLALELGAASAGAPHDPPPEPLDAAILFAPVGDLVPAALAALDRGGTLAVAGIHLTDIPPLNYQGTCSRSARCAASPPTPAPTAASSSPFAGTHRLRVETVHYPLSEADPALTDLVADRVNGAAVLIA